MLIDRFKPELKDIIQENFSEFTQIQKQAMPSVLDGKNTLIIAPTGSGKTESAFLPVLNNLVGSDKSEKKGIVALYIAPLRSLNRDMLRRMEEWCAAIGCTVEVRHGDTTQSQRSRQRVKPPHVLITTPETLQAILPAKVMRKHLESVKYVIIDEVHELVSDKRGIQLSIGLERLRKLAGNFQTIGISATVGTPNTVANYYHLDEIVIDKSFKGLDLKVEKARGIIPRIKELTGKKSTLIFTNTRVATELLTKQLRNVADVGIHHSSLSKEERIDAENLLKEGKLKTLVCTSSMELGIDVGEIEQVIQINSPRQVARLLQRVGRSGHTHQKVSKGTVLASDFDDLIEASVIAKRALNSEIEKTDYYELSLDVLANQIVGMVLEYGDISLNDLYLTIKKAYPYRNLTPDIFDSVVDVLKRIRLVGWNKNELSRRRNSLFYYYSNLSTIPTHNRYFVIDLASQKPVGVLDEEYILDCHVNSLFILKGDVWRIVDFRDKRVMVVPVSDVGADTPVWVGEDLPVPYDVAQEVGKIRRKVSKYLDGKPDKKKIAKQLDLPINSLGTMEIINTIKKQKEQGEVPTDRLITIEKFIENYPQVVINTCFGTRVNDTISRLLASLLSTKYGETVGVKVDPYRIVLTGLVLDEDDIIEELRSINPKTIEDLLEKTVAQTNLFRFSFAHVGKRFGVFKSDINFREINIRRVIDSYRETAVYKESRDEMFKKYFDLEKSKLALRRIQSGEIDLAKQTFTTVSQFGLDQFKDAVAAETPERAIVETVKGRLLSRKVDLVCLNCGELMRHRTIETLEYPITCPVCESWMISYMGKTHEEISRLVRKQKRGETITKEEKRLLNRAQQSAGLIHSYEKLALLAMNARGVGPKTANRVLELNLSDDDFFKEILRAEREFVRTSRFWKK